MKKINFFVIAILFFGSFLFVSCNETSETEATTDEITEAEDNSTINNEADKYHSVDGKFKVNFTGTPKVSNEKVPTEVGDIEMFMFMYEKSLTEIEMIAYSDYPSAIVAVSDKDEMLNGAKEGALSNLEAVIKEEKQITYKGHKGIEFKANSSQYYVNYKIFLVNNRLYQIALMRDGSYATQSNVDKFFNSFELLEN